MVDLPPVRALESAAISGWPALKSVFDGLWLWRGSRGYSKRANSIHCLDPSDGADAELRLRKLAALSRSNGIIPTFRVTPLTAPELFPVFDALRWVVHEPSLTLAMAMPSRLPVDAKIRLLLPDSSDWRIPHVRLSDYDEQTALTLKMITGLYAHEARGIQVLNGDEPVASALCAQIGGIAVFHNVVVREDLRGNGYGRALMHAAINWTRDAGASHAMIQVLASNELAVGLYRSLGFTDAYPYHYRRPAE